jgi:hypothetical protein
MRVNYLRRIGCAMVAAVLLATAGGTRVFAQASSNFKVDEYQFGTGGEVDLQSLNYRAQGSAGSLGVGSSSSANYDAEAGFLTPNEPFLEMIVTAATVDLGVLSTTSSASGAAQAGTCNCSFSVRTYLSSEYSVLTMSSPPTSENGSVLAAKSTLGVPSVSQTVEEFGINLVDNSSPNIGANPTNDPNNSFADGKAETGYATPNQFKYGLGDIIARSPATAGNQAVGKTNYTISYIAKIKPTTAAGAYAMNHDIVVVATY